MLHTYSEVVARALVIAREMQEAQRLRSKNSGFGGSTKGPRRCYECGEVGHLRRECPKFQRLAFQPSQQQFQQVKITKLNNLLTSNLHFLSLTQVAAGEMVQNKLQPPYKGVSKHPSMRWQPIWLPPIHPSRRWHSTNSNFPILHFSPSSYQK